MPERFRDYAFGGSDSTIDAVVLHSPARTPSLYGCGGSRVKVSGALGTPKSEGRRGVNRPASSGRDAVYFLSVMIQVTSSLISAGGTAAFGGIGIWPQTPVLPSLTLLDSISTAFLSLLYLAATST